jgi:AMP nucleosidase
LGFSLRDVFDVPDLAITNDDIVNGDGVRNADGSVPLAPFTAQRVDYSLARLSHYTATDPSISRTTSCSPTTSSMSTSSRPSRAGLADPDSGYISFVAPGNIEITDPKAPFRRCRACRRCRPTT